MTSIANPAELTLQTASVLGAIKDRDSLQLVSRLIDAQVTLLEAQLVQQKQLQAAVQERAKTIK